MNPLYTQMNPQNNLIAQFNRFKQNFHGDPRQQVQELLNSGKVSQQQYDEAVRKANALRQMLGM